MTTKEKGDLVVAKAISTFTEAGWQVLIPLGDKQKYDLVVDDGKSLRKVQCKYAGTNAASGAYAARLVVSGGNRSRHTMSYYKPGDFDLLFVMTPVGDFYQIPADVAMKNTTMLTLCEKYAEYRLN